MNGRKRKSARRHVFLTRRAGWPHTTVFFTIVIQGSHLFPSCPLPLINSRVSTPCLRFRTWPPPDCFLNKSSNPGISDRRSSSCHFGIPKRRNKITLCPIEKTLFTGHLYPPCLFSPACLKRDWPRSFILYWCIQPVKESFDYGSKCQRDAKEARIHGLPWR